MKNNIDQRRIYVNLRHLGFTPEESVLISKMQYGLLEDTSLERLASMQESNPEIQALVDQVSFAPGIIKKGYNVAKQWDLSLVEPDRVEPRALLKYLSIKKVAFCNLVARGYHPTSAAVIAGMGSSKGSSQAQASMAKYDVSVRDLVTIVLLDLREKEMKERGLTFEERTMVEDLW